MFRFCPILTFCFGGIISLSAVFLGDIFYPGLIHTLLSCCLVSAHHFFSPCRLTTSVYAAQRCPKARFCLCASRRTCSPRTARERTVGRGIRSMSGRFLSAAGWWAKPKAPRTWRLETPSWCAAFTAPERQSGKMRPIWNVEGTQLIYLYYIYWSKARL